MRYLLHPHAKIPSTTTPRVVDFPARLIGTAERPPPSEVRDPGGAATARRREGTHARGREGVAPLPGATASAEDTAAETNRAEMHGGKAPGVLDGRSWEDDVEIGWSSFVDSLAMLSTILLFMYVSCMFMLNGDW